MRERVVAKTGRKHEGKDRIECDAHTNSCTGMSGAARAANMGGT
jgi:hypothetical protein